MDVRFTWEIGAGPSWAKGPAPVREYYFRMKVNVIGDIVDYGANITSVFIKESRDTKEK